MQQIKFSAGSQIITQSGSVESNCNGLLFINLGVSVATVLGYPIQQGQQFSVPCNVGEFDTTNYNVMFDNLSDNKQLLIIRKIYDGAMDI